MITIKTHHELLSDGSAVFNVLLIDLDEPAVLKLPAVSERDAEALRFKLVEALRDHSNETVREW